MLQKGLKRLLCPVFRAINKRVRITERKEKTMSEMLRYENFLSGLEELSRRYGIYIKDGAELKFTDGIKGLEYVHDFTKDTLEVCEIELI